MEILRRDQIIGATKKLSHFNDDGGGGASDLNQLTLGMGEVECKSSALAKIDLDRHLSGMSNYYSVLLDCTEGPCLMVHLGNFMCSLRLDLNSLSWSFLGMQSGGKITGTWEMVRDALLQDIKSFY